MTLFSFGYSIFTVPANQRSHCDNPRRRCRCQFFFLNTKRCWIPSTKFHWITKCHVSIWSGRCNHPSAWNDKTALAKTLYIPRQINVFWFLYQPNQLYCDVVQHHSSEVAEINFYKPPPSPHLKEKSFCPF